MMRFESLRTMGRLRLRGKNLKDLSTLYTSTLLPATSRLKTMKPPRQPAMRLSNLIPIPSKPYTVELVQRLFLLILEWRTSARQ